MKKMKKKTRIPRERLCYYCHIPGHQIYMCKAKENDEVTQLIRQAINAGVRTQKDDVHCREDMISELTVDNGMKSGFTVRKSGDSCKTFPMFSSLVVNTINDMTGLTKEEELGLKEKRRLQDMCGIDDEFKNDYLNSYFETLNVSDKMKLIGT
ncbi:putative transcription factor interactor and regulator CCHC(Zn) family [Helianthus anomalus]